MGKKVNLPTTFIIPKGSSRLVLGPGLVPIEEIPEGWLAANGSQFEVVDDTEASTAESPADDAAPAQDAPTNDDESGDTPDADGEAHADDEAADAADADGETDDDAGDPLADDAPPLEQTPGKGKKRR